MKVRRLNGRKRGLKYNSVDLGVTPKELKALLRGHKEGKNWGLSEPPPKDRVVVYSISVVKD